MWEPGFYYTMASLGRPGAVLIPWCPVIFNGNNWGEFSFHMGGQRLWGYLTGEWPCPPTPPAPTPPTYAPNATDEVKKPLLDAFEAELEAYKSNHDSQAA